MARHGLASTATLGVRTSAVAARPPSGQRSLIVAIADSLIAGETIVFESRKHWMAPIRASLTAGLHGHRGGLRPLALAQRRGPVRDDRRDAGSHRPRPVPGRDRLDHLQHRRLADGRVRRHEHACPARGGARLAPELDHAAVVAERRQDERRGPGPAARLRRHHAADDVGRVRRGSLPRDHPPARLPRRSDGAEDPRRPRSSRPAAHGRRKPGGRAGGRVRHHGGCTCPGPHRE